MRHFLLAALIVATPAVALADPVEETIAARRGYFNLVGLEFKPIAAMAKGDMAYDAEAVKAHAADLLTLTQYTQGDLMMPGTSVAEAPGKTRSKAEIWTDMPGYQAKGTAFVEAVIALNAAAAGPQADLGAAVAKLGGTCKDCHDSYRTKDF
ncbi:cytochrome c [Paracoccaceae bacterium Fryx2]|nr:cytochrome c [Paracoccaceae bacterium Fryx2]